MYPELLDYIKKTKAAGLAEEQIKQELQKVGWPQAEIDLAIKKAGSQKNKTVFFANKNIQIILYIILGLGLFAACFGVLWYLDKQFNLAEAVFKLIDNYK